MYIVDVVATPVIHDFTDVLAASVTKREGSTSSLARPLRGALGSTSFVLYLLQWFFGHPSSSYQIIIPAGPLQPTSGNVPILFTDAGSDAVRRFIEFFRHEVPAHHNAEAYVDVYLAAAQIAEDRKGPLFPSLDRERYLTERRLHRLEALATPANTCGVCRCGVIKRRAQQAGLPLTTCYHTFRATGITTYLQDGGTIEHAQQIANHESPRTTRLYDRTNDAISLDEIERILIRACLAK